MCLVWNIELQREREEKTKQEVFNPPEGPGPHQERDPASGPSLEVGAQVLVTSLCSFHRELDQRENRWDIDRLRHNGSIDFTTLTILVGSVAWSMFTWVCHCHCSPALWVVIPSPSLSNTLYSFHMNELDYPKNITRGLYNIYLFTNENVFSRLTQIMTYFRMFFLKLE